MDYFFQVTLNGLMLCGLYALMAQGLALIWGVLDVVNLAHGDFIVLGSFLAWWGFGELGWDPYLAAPVIGLVGVALGWFLSRAVVLPLLGQHFVMTLLATFAVSIIMQSLMRLTFGPSARLTDVPYAATGFSLLGVRVPLIGVVNTVVAFSVLGALQLFLRRTRQGKAVRAVSENQEAARLVGIDLKKIFTLAVACAIGLTMISGALLSSVEPFYPFVGPSLTLKIFAIVALGGLGSMGGLVIAAAFVALTESYLGAYVAEIGTGLGATVAFVLLVVVLAIRRGGVAGAQAMDGQL